MSTLWRWLGIGAFWLSWPGLYIRLRRSVRVRIVLHHQGNVLLVKNWYNSGQWQLPGGGIRSGESPTATAQRELAEETAIEISERSFSLVGKPFPVRERGLPFRVQVLVADAPSEAVATQKHEIIAFKWKAPSVEITGISDSTRKAFALVENLP